MAKTQTSQRDEKHELTRRALIKWSVAAGAALGVSRSKIYEILEGTAGKGVAYAAAEQATTRAVCLQAGNGGLAWFTQFWQQYDIVKARNATFSWNYPGQETDITGNKQPLAIGPATPWASLPAQRQVTCFLSGANETHNNIPMSNGTLNGNSIFAVISALQAAAPCTIPVVTIGGSKLGTAPGAAAESNVANADGIVGLFNSAASQMNGLLSKPTDAALYKAHFDAFIQLNRAANRPTTKAAYTTASSAAAFLGKNLSTQLQITQDDLTRYGITGNTRGNVTAIGRALIVTAKAFGLGLCNTVLMPAMNDDPHGAFDGGDVNTVPMQLKGIFDAFMTDCAKTTDPDGTTLADDLVFTISGDTYKDPLSRPGWGDGTPNNTNVVYVYSSGHLEPGWFGGVDRAGKALGFGADGKPAPYNSANTAKFATAAIAYAVAKRDERAIANFANGVTIGGVFGKLKDK